MPEQFIRCFFFILAGAVFLTTSEFLSSAAEVKASQSSLNDGYSIFYDFCNQESQLSLLMWVKTTPPGVEEFAERIAATAKEDVAILRKFGVEDRALRLNKVSLPSFEIDVRKSMADDRQRQLVWDTSGVAFARALVMTQGETTNYGLHVAKVLAETEPEPGRARAMRNIYDKWLALHVEAYRLSR